MNDDELEPQAMPAVQDPRQLPAAYWAFHELYLPVYKRYAELHLGDFHLADEIVHQVLMDIASEWFALMEDANPTATAWAFLKHVIADELDAQRRESAMTETAVFARIARDLLDTMRGELAAMDSDLGLYPAIARLPGQRFDVMVLMYVLGYTMDKTARIMGIAPTTVRSHRDRARRQIARELQPDMPDADK